MFKELQLTVEQIEKFTRHFGEMSRVRATILTLVHVHKRPITYKELAAALKTNVRGMGAVLGQLLWQDYEDNLPLTCALVVNAATGKPSDGFFEGLIYHQIFDVDALTTQTQRDAVWDLYRTQFADVSPETRTVAYT